MLSRHPLREGLIAGTLGAAGIAAWTIAADGLTGRIGVTPALIGASLLNVLGVGARSFAIHVAFWAITLFAAVITVGVVTSYIYNAAERRPSFWRGLVLLVLVLEVLYLTVVALAASSELFGIRAWIYGLVGNILAAVVMGRYLWRQHHPEARWDWEKANDSHFHTDNAPPQARV